MYNAAMRIITTQFGRRAVQVLLELLIVEFILEFRTAYKETKEEMKRERTDKREHSSGISFNGGRGFRLVRDTSEFKP